jgi:hypothetical protein
MCAFKHIKELNWELQKALHCKLLAAQADTIQAACHKPQLDVQWIQRYSNGIIKPGMQNRSGEPVERILFSENDIDAVPKRLPM